MGPFQAKEGKNRLDSTLCQSPCCVSMEGTRRTHAKETVASIANTRREGADYPAAKRLT